MVRCLLILSMISILFCSCGENKTDVKQEPEINTTLPSPDSIQILLGQFPTIDPANLHIYSPCDAIDGQKFKGNMINVAFYKFLQFGNNLTLIKSDTSAHLYSCYHFKFAKNKTGLILRVPSQNDATAIDLYLWDDSARKVVNVINLADAFGDGGWFFVQDAWLTDINNDKQFDIIKRKKDYEDSDDTTKINNIDSLFVILGNGDKFKKSSVKVDTEQYKILE